ncbi:stage 0 sporulation family protein [Tetragenococcus koreensis]|uniref:Signal peptidase n=1 Tax=Tetragenococcus koreensis TaxID=290335 RepID=A0AAN4RKV1_9ENTE|nr:stage 0 sporulation family protein [Tetragenococcus koreensis]MCF1584275.1 stage 0 sporulation family protein [Tetragenococcus koreensis]MCF1613791.1 stage 0 sporulation family protein [Tetragenococcus koreensis]MCF1616636.1 stage 0 sporulation family protein [Tetragenococcus koreensis]MCF1620535.1 stage 0 sporulation family protein [Tetragenococcus koreensis]MCF1621509.1 stage 0 sporulation family protein [Tetragenococcus koreensis]
MINVVGVRYEKTGPIYYFSSGKEEFSYGDKVLVEKKQVKAIAKVVISNKEMAEKDLPDKINTVLHKATKEELLQDEKNQQEAQNALAIGRQKVRENQVAMKLVDAKYTFDRRRMVFHFIAEGRVDFRGLVKELARIFKTRIELRQVGVRDQAKIVGGIGPCGRQLCCSTFLGEFAPVSIKMAKDQGLSLNPNKISGLCGRLMCCLNYENDEYVTAKKELPDYGTTILTPEGKGRVVGLNLLSRVIKVRLTSQQIPVEYDYEELKETLKAGDTYVDG